MNLQYTLPDELQGLIVPYKQEEVVYCVPCDIKEGAFVDGFLVVTKKRLLLLLDGSIEKNLLLEEICDAKAEGVTDCGQLILTGKDQVDFLFCRMTMRHLSRYAYVARGIRLLLKGSARKVVSAEHERICPVCGRALPGTAVCPKCGGKGRAWRRVVDVVKPYRWQFLLCTMFMLAATILNVAISVINRDLVDNVLLKPGATITDALWRLGALALVLTCLVICYLRRNLLSVKLGSQISLDLRERMYVKIQRLSIQYLSRQTPGALMNRMMNDTRQIRAFMENTFSGVFNQLMIMFFFLICMFIMDWKLTLLSIALIPFTFIISMVSRKFFARIFTKQWIKSDKVNSHLQDVLSGIRVVKSFGMEERESESFRKGNQEIAELSSKNEKTWSTIMPVFSFIFSIASLIITLYGGMGILEGTFTPGELAMFSFYAGALYGPMQWLGNIPRVMVQMLTSLERIYDVLEEADDIVQNDNAVDKTIEGNISFDNLGFGYTSYEPVLENFNLEVKQGEMIGLVGKSGAGKSTLINLIMRMYDVDEGSLRIDGVDIRDFDKNCLHKQIGVVLQEPFLFSGTVLENIRYAVPEATLEEVMLAAKLANAHDFIVSFADGYNTRVGENGHNLSGGERQRVAIARAILNNPKILILDEATSALDTETEYQIQEALARLIKGRTTFAIAHRLSTLRGADRIVVIDKHTCAELGTHDELLRKKGIYYGLVMAQLNMSKVTK